MCPLPKDRYAAPSLSIYDLSPASYSMYLVGCVCLCVHHEAHPGTRKMGQRPATHTALSCLMCRMNVRLVFHFSVFFLSYNEARCIEPHTEIYLGPFPTPVLLLKMPLLSVRFVSKRAASTNQDLCKHAAEPCVFMCRLVDTETHREIRLTKQVNLQAG